MINVNILLEGDKDVHFLHEFILRRFAGFARQKNGVPNLRKRSAVEMVNDPGDVRIVLHKMNGYKVLSQHSELLVPGADVVGEFVSAVIFDSDYPDDCDCGGQADRRKSIKQLVQASSRHVDLPDDRLFLFPDNQTDGDLEVLMERMVVDTESHRSFLEICWRNFQECVRKHGFNETSQKSKMNEFTAAFNKGTWRDGGINAAFADVTLWNWNVAALSPLYDFVSRLISTEALATGEVEGE